MARLDIEASLDAEQPLLRQTRGSSSTSASKLRGAAGWICVGVVLVFLIVMAAVTTGGGSSRRGAPAGPTFTVPPGGVKGCDDSEPLCLIARPVPSPEADYRGHPRKVSGSRGLVAADQSRCSDIGATVLEEGGHAVDAVVATCLCQGVVNPFASGVGGGFFALVRSANGSTVFLNAREMAPGAASAEMYTGKEAGSSLWGGLAVAVPLELKGLEAAWRRFGRLPWARLVAPAAAIAAHGFAAHPYYVYMTTEDSTLTRLKSDPLTGAAFLVRERDGSFRAPRVGELVGRRPMLAATLEAVGRYGVSWLYAPQRLEAMAAEVRAAGGILTASDFKNAEVRFEAPLSYTLPGPVPYTLLVPPPPSSGTVLYLALALLLGYGNSSTAFLAQMGPELAAHRTVEAMKHAFAVRMALGDPGTPAAPFVDVGPVLADIGNASFVDELRSRINDTGVQPVSQYGGRWNPQVVGVSPDDRGTSHIAVLDAEGNSVSLTTTINTAFGSNVISKSTGILFNNEMDDFSQPGAPNKYNLQPAVTNYIAPFKRPLSSMAPALVLSPGGALKLVVGASNGPRIITGILQTILRILYGGADPLSAVSDSRLHHQWQPSEVLYEDYSLNGVPFIPDAALIASLAAKGNTMSPHHDQLGDVQAILLDDGVSSSSRGGGNNDSGNGISATAVADPRKDGAPAAALR